MTTAIAGKVAGVYTAVDAAGTAFTGEATTANTAKTRYTISNAAKAYWPLGATITVKKNGTTQTSGFHLERAGGVVVFDAALTSETITVDGTYVTPTEVAGWYDWKATESDKELDVTDFMDADAGYESFILSGIISASVSASRHFQNTSFATAADSPLLFKCFIDTGTLKARYEGWGYMTQVGIDASANAVIEESVSATITGGLYYREG